MTVPVQAERARDFSTGGGGVISEDCFGASRGGSLTCVTGKVEGDLEMRLDRDA